MTSAQGPRRRALRGRVLHYVDDPARSGAAARRHIEDGLIVIEDGRVAALGEARDLLPTLPPGAEVVDHRPHLLLPGFIDTHLHFPQTQVIASYGAQLLDWLSTYTFPEEAKYADAAHAAAGATFLFDELLRNGTTTGVVYCSVHPQSAEAFFAEAARRNLRMIGGKVMMDRNAPPSVLDTAQRGYDETKALIARWHGRGRALYAVSPRFAITSTPAQLAAAGALVAEHPDCYMQTHVSENLREIAFAKELFPEASGYLDIYDRHGLLGPRSLFGHCLHLTEAEKTRMAETGSVIAFCPTSNLFLGSGLFDLASAEDARRPIRVGLATDIGGGTSYSMLTTMAEAYKILQLQGQSLTADRAFYMMTLGNARALGLEAEIGSLAIGAEADVVVLDPRATPAMAHRMATARTLDEELFILMMMGDARSVAATYVMGERA